MSTGWENQLMHGEGIYHEKKGHLLFTACQMCGFADIFCLFDKLNIFGFILVDKHANWRWEFGVGNRDEHVFQNNFFSSAVIFLSFTKVVILENHFRKEAYDSAERKKTTTVTSNRCFFNCTIDIKQGSWQTALSMLYCIRNWYENHQTHDTSDCQDWWRSFSGRIIILADRFSLSAELQLRDRKKLLVNNVCLSATGVISISTEQLTGFSVSNPFNTHTF